MVAKEHELEAENSVKEQEEYIEEEDSDFDPEQGEY
jgi:hypothetical protein